MNDIRVEGFPELIKKVIAESNLELTTKSIIEEFMLTEQFKTIVKDQVEIQVKKTIEKYADYYILGDRGFEELGENVKRFIIDYAKEKGKHVW